MLTITERDLKKFTPKARPEYVMALIGNLYDLRTAGILENSYRLSHFMAQIAHETGGLTIGRESLNYTSAKRLREVWPARFRDKTDSELAPLVRNERKLGDAVYLGRMGNSQPGDGYDYRGGGFLQTTGREAVSKYAKALGLEPSPSLLDDPATTLKFACLEWQESDCNEHADENDITKVSKAINTGSATGNVKPVGMQGRQDWFAQAWSIWGEKGTPDTVPKLRGLGELIGKVALPVGLVSGGGTGAGLGLMSVPSVPDLSQLVAARSAIETAGQLTQWLVANWQWAGICVGAYLVVCHVSPWVAEKVKAT